MTLQHLFATVVSTPSDINEHLEELHDAVIRLQARTVIELGVRHGNSTIALLHALELTQGHLWSVDMVKQWNGIPMDRWTFIEGSDINESVMAMLPSEADIIFVDTSHMYRHTLAEIQAYRERVRPGGMMIFHDTAVEVFDHHMPGTEPPFPVRQAVMESFPDETKRVFVHNNGLTEVLL